MTALQRHTLCWLEPSTLDEIAAQLEDEFGHLPAVLRQQAREYLLSGSLPGIVRRGLRSENSVPLGFSFPLRWQGQRVRLATEAALSAIARYSTPEQTASLSIAERTNAIGAFHALRQAWRWPGLQLGVWGSVGLEMATPWRWSDAHSDLDIRVIPTAPGELNACWACLRHTEEQFQLRIDGEIGLADGYAINIKEWFSGSATLLAKGEDDVQLRSRQQVTAAMRTYLC
ncbi:malonate decarboxylase holo-[acyl-carrier-protein] synthase [Klebsiella grimontii]|uniref:malonate decarboxylase holo-[acyl-carrier-protein] synthase n=1 Tax=Klebsiella grimontii TaxID=2058152 RepID=UPI0011E46F0F|nr:malonate decarboxylase holo-[acyl-carrier-protein] synthase [Klebsiella grimontii]TYF92789.1 malonate decarboxylase holo-[acyl-carrier-protein] synthase [Klebsiella grimontii]